MMKNRITSLHQQSGVVLVVSLIMLVLLTLIGTTGTQVTSLEEKMSGNARDQNIAFQAAESTLMVAERFILANDTGSTTYTGSNGLLNVGDSELDYFAAATWTGSNSAVTANSFAQRFVNHAGKSIPNPRYVIKKIRPGAESFYKITARAQGIGPGTQVVLQVIFSRN